MFLIPTGYWEIKKTKDKGRGVFARKPIRQGALIGDYLGKLVQLKDFDFNKEKKKLYLMYYNDETGIYPDLKKPGVYLINHSCCPNCWIIKLQNHTIFFALRNINIGEELTISYLLPPKNLCKNCTHTCRCESKNCTKSMHLTQLGYKKWQDFQNKEERRKKYKRVNNKNTLRPLAKYPESVSKSYIVKIKNLGII